MMSHLKRLLGLDKKEEPVTIKDVEPAEVVDTALERETRKATTQLRREVLKIERRSWEVRQELASSALALVHHDGKEQK